MLYKEYIKVEPDFIPVFSASKDRDHPERWKAFYPHESFKKILAAVVETLEKGSASKDQPIWVIGSYGTGKTYASFVIKHILEDEVGEVERYFARRELSSLRQRVMGLRGKEKILVVHQSSSAGINSQSKLLNTIVEGVKRGLRSNGYTYTGAASILDKVLGILKDPESTFNFRAAFKKYPEKFMEYTSAEEVIEDLETLEETERIELLEEITEVAERESYNWSMTVTDVIAWLRDVRARNNLYAIFFIWDEFTEYFRNNLNNISGLQELAQAGSEMSFYFFLITHSDVNQLITDTAQRKVMESRFKIRRIELAESTAFQLMGQALIIEPELKSEWTQISHELWESVRRGGGKYITEHDTSVKLEDMRKLLPIHPYAAYILKFIAQLIGSNQRTMFQFLCDGEERGFGKFLDGHEYKSDGEKLLTADYLWEYFFQEDDSDLDKTFREALGYYNNFSGLCKNESQHRILKTALILLALQQKNVGRRVGVNALLRSTLKNICASFSGTTLEADVAHTMNYFVKRGIFSPLEESEDVSYVITNTQVDSERLGKIIEQVQQEQSLEKIINDESYGIPQKFKPSNYLQYRLNIQMISPGKFLQSGNITMSAAVNRIPTYYIFATDEAEQGKVNQAIRKIREKFSDWCLIVDFTGTPFTRQRYEKFILNKAREQYFRDVPNQAGQVKLAKKSAGDIVEEWIEQLEMANARIWYSAEDSEQGSIRGSFFRVLGELNRKFFGSGPEEIYENDRFFSLTGLTENVAKCALDLLLVRNSYSWLRGISDEYSDLTAQGGEYWLKRPSHPLSRMKAIVEDVIRKNLAQRKEVGLWEIWESLKRPPVGLMRCAGSVFIFTLMLREYADKNFYIRDVNNNAGLLTSVGLTGLAVVVVKELPQAHEKFLMEQTPQQEKFCWMSAEIFKIGREKAGSIDDTIKNVRIRLAQNRFPLGMLRYFVERELEQDSRKGSCLEFLKLFGEILKPQNNRNLLKLADEIFGLYDKNHGIVDKLKSVVSRENFEAGTMLYSEQRKPELKAICERLEITAEEYIGIFTAKMAADAAYLWKEEEVNRQLDNIYGELSLIEAMNSILSIRQKSMLEMRKALKERLNRIRISREIVETFYPRLQGLMRVLVEINENKTRDFAGAAREINVAADEFRTFFNSQLSVFSEALSVYVNGTLGSEILEKLFREMSTGTFFLTQDEFIGQMKLKVKKLNQSDQVSKFFSVWHEVTGTASPEEWSNKNEIPILCIFEDCLDEAQTYFPVLNRHMQMPGNVKLDEAIGFLKGDKVSRLSDKDKCERQFLSYFCGEDYLEVVDAEGLRGLLHRCAGNDVYSWFTKKKVYSEEIKTFTIGRYRQEYLPVAREKVRSLSAQEAQSYLEELVDKDPLFGIRILRSRQGESP